MVFSDDFLFQSVKQIVADARKHVFQLVNSTLLMAYWQIRQLFFEDEQKGKERAEYGKFTLKNLFQRLNLEFGKGFDYTNLSNMCTFYLAFPIVDSLRQQLIWSHYRLLSSHENVNKRNNYLNEAKQNNWNLSHQNSTLFRKRRDYCKLFCS